MEELYQDFLIELYKHPLNFGKMQEPGYRAEIYNSTCGDRIELFLRVKDGVVSEATFVGTGCVISQASSSLFTGYLKGKKTSELGKIKKEDALALLKIDLSRNPSRMKCALLPFEAMKKISASLGS